MRFALLFLLLASPLAAAPPVASLAYRGDGGLLAAGTHGAVALVDPATGDFLANLPGQNGRVTALAFSKAGTLAVASGEPGKSGTVRLYDLGKSINAKPTAEIAAHRDAIYALAFSPDGSTLASAGYDRAIKLWSVAKPDAPKMTLLDHSDAVYSVAFHPNGQLLASGSADRAVKVWDAATGKRLYTLGDPTDWVYAVAWSPDGTKLAAGGVDKSIRVWTATAEAGKLVKSVFAHERGVLKLAYSSDGGTLYSVGEDAVVKGWDSAKMVERKVFPKQSASVHALALRPDGKQLALGRHDGEGIFFDPATGTKGATFLPAVPKPPTVTKAAPGSGSRGKTVRVVLEGQRLDTVTAIKANGIDVKIVSAEPARLVADFAISAKAVSGTVPYTLVSTAEHPPANAFTVDRYDAVRESGTTDSARTAMVVKLPATILGSVDRAGDTDYFAFDAKAGDQIGAQISGGNAKFEPRLSIADAAGRVLAESDRDTIGFVVPKAGRYAIAVRDKDIAAART